jgi:hypothetical protein
LFGGGENQRYKSSNQMFVKSRDSGCAMGKVYRSIRESRLVPD